MIGFHSGMIPMKIYLLSTVKRISSFKKFFIPDEASTKQWSSFPFPQYPNIPALAAGILYLLDKGSWGRDDK